MARSDSFVEAEGAVHLLNPIMADFTLCGDAFDLASDVEGYEQTPTRRRTVTCGGCAAIIRECRGVRCAVTPSPYRSDLG
jgi:hypothetical protein